MDKNNLSIGKPNSNPTLDSRKYEVEYLDGTLEVLSANIIAENLTSQVDNEGHRNCMLDETVEHRNDNNVISTTDSVYTDQNNITRQQYNTKGWQICVQLKDGSSNLVEMKDIKDSYPVELVGYAIAANIDHLPAFSWWAPYTLKKRSRILSKLK